MAYSRAVNRGQLAFHHLRGFHDPFEAKPRLARSMSPVISIHSGPDEGRLRIGIRPPCVPFLLRASLATGFGASGLRLDRGAPGKVRVAEFRLVADRIMLVERNKHFLATGDEASALAGTESFPTSVLWSAPVDHEADGEAVADATGLVLADHHGIAGALRAAGQGRYTVDQDRSIPLPGQSRAGQAGAWLAGLLTFAGSGDGDTVRAVAPAAEALTFVQYLSLVPLPEPAMPARRYHPGSGGYGIGHADYGRPAAAGSGVRLQPRFRLEPLGGGAVRKPIVFYVDPAIPEPVRSAVVTGGNWWREGFARIGLPEAYRVEVLPDGVDRHDPAANVVWWVHRAGRGWSRGAGLTDPRTGEIVTGRVLLGSQRVEQVTAIAEALLAPYGQPDEAERLQAVEDLVLSRMRQLAAHEIGHALGFMHNYASTLHAKPSVMDYPHPRLTVGPDGAIDVSGAYSEGLGPWDLFLVEHAYREFPDGDDEEQLAGLRRRAAGQGLPYVTDEDGHAVDAGHVDGVPWVVPGDALAGLEEILRVRGVALERFSPAVLPPGRQAGELEERAALLYLLHRHQVTAVARLIGGVRYAYVTAGDGGTGTQAVSGPEQRTALTQLSELLRAEYLALPAAVLDTVTPPAIRYARTGEYLDTGAGRVFDPLSAAAAGAALVAGPVLEPSRLNRVAWQHARDAAVPGVPEIIAALLAATWHGSEAACADRPGGAAVQRAANWTVLRYLLETLEQDTLHPQVRAEVRESLRALAAEFLDQGRPAGQPGHPGDQAEAAALINGYLADPRSVRLDPLPRIPPGAPI
jgi:Met-zincin/Domain of unknown function (DUF5117)